MEYKDNNLLMIELLAQIETSKKLREANTELKQIATGLYKAIEELEDKLEEYKG
jgi:hypothetical protein